MSEYVKTLLAKVRKMSIADEIAAEIVTVQPIDPEPFLKMLKLADREEDLISAGFRPVSNFKLMWVKP
ncbi:hypothetical protein CPT_Mendera_271 [Stenotrophomonas phage Mendera]|uniref:Uncharacterized protein n=1 Tax=Stenotrophomonas phage Mendera TaxID=2650877 RepID=A0A5P8PJ95_9CAUD|nr:hypothetical protein HWC60_gp144 [Stenotrophomonas phage Mendera]QFR56797.1 hypothetical protein CPT_Mendera_271 [Stenotrophomonas phage Mendera]QYW02779.1 hypothetical protein CPT_Marzo_261 [Stenotrophomonas phage Marzo]